MLVGSHRGSAITGKGQCSGIRGAEMADTTLNLQDYLDAAGDAAKRTRTVTFVVVAASVLAFACLLNSLQGNWMKQRLDKLGDPNSQYSRQKLGVPGDRELTPEDKARHLALYTAVARAYIENTYTVRVPLLGITFDVNDLGLLGGFSLCTILLWFRFSVAREYDNLRIAFSQAKRDKQLPALYVLLAMRQVLTTPPMEVKERSRTFSLLPKILLLMPIVVLTSIIGHDLATYEIGTAISDIHTISMLLGSTVLWAFALVVTVSCILTLTRIDAVWRDYWTDVKPTVLIRMPPVRDAAGTEE
jgi:hypothetical protein